MRNGSAGLLCGGPTVLHLLHPRVRERGCSGLQQTVAEPLPRGNRARLPSSKKSRQFGKKTPHQLPLSSLFQMLTQLVCVPVARTEMFTYNVTVCDRSHTTTKYGDYLWESFTISSLRYKVVTWENEELKEVNSTFNQEVKNITTCEFSYINKTVVENVPKVREKKKMTRKIPIQRLNNWSQKWWKEENAVKCQRRATGLSFV